MGILGQVVIAPRRVWPQRGQSCQGPGNARPLLLPGGRLRGRCDGLRCGAAATLRGAVDVRWDREVSFLRTASMQGATVRHSQGSVCGVPPGAVDPIAELQVMLATRPGTGTAARGDAGSREAVWEVALTSSTVSWQEASLGTVNSLDMVYSGTVTRETVLASV